MDPNFAEAQRNYRRTHSMLRYVLKRLPGKKTIDNLYRIAMFLDGCDDQEDGDALRALAVKLAEARKPFYIQEKPYKRYGLPD